MSELRPVNTLALKEWAVVVHALGTGRQIVLLRKGGLHERQGWFATEPTEFFLFPTYVHQMEQGVVRDAETDLQTAIAARPPEDRLCIEHYATVEDLRWLDTHQSLTALAGLHCWTPETVAQRFAYGKTAGLHLFVLRVYRLRQSYTLPLLKRYSGCRSWVDLEGPLSTAGAVPVLNNAVFTERVDEVKERLSAEDRKNS